MKVIIQKPDLDTCLTAFILGVSVEDSVFVSTGEASAENLANHDVFCIEAGGSGQVNNNNFDHHDTDENLQTACMQAFQRVCCTKVDDVETVKLKRLVEYVSMVDENPSAHPRVNFPSLSNIFSGMLLVEKDPVGQFHKGIEMLRYVIENHIDPFGTMPDMDVWRVYKDAKVLNRELVREVMKKAEFFVTKRGLKVGYCESGFIGGTGTLFEQSCSIAVMYNSMFGEPPYRKFTIAGKNVEVYGLVDIFDRLEKGWGGRESIIGSPRRGTVLEKRKVLDIIIRNM